MTPEERLEYLIGLTPPITKATTRCACGTEVHAEREPEDTNCCTCKVCPVCGMDVILYFLIPEPKNPATQGARLHIFYLTDPLFHSLVQSDASPAEMIIELVKDRNRLMSEMQKNLQEPHKFKCLECGEVYDEDHLDCIICGQEEVVPDDEK